MLGMVLHIHVQEGENGVYVDGARVLAVVVRVFSQAGVLGQAKELLQPAPVETGQEYEHHRQEAAYSQRPDGKSADYGEMNAAGPVHFGQFPLRYKVQHVGVRTAEGVANEAPHFGGPAAQVEEVQEDLEQVGGPLHLDFGVAADEIGVGMVAGVAPAPHIGLANGHEGGDIVNNLVQPMRSERGAVAGFVPAGVGGGIYGSVDEKGGEGPPRSPGDGGEVGADAD